jgi:hypothetical protein
MGPKENDTIASMESRYINIEWILQYIFDYDVNNLQRIHIIEQNKKY